MQKARYSSYNQQAYCGGENSLNGAKDKYNNNYILKMMIAQDEFNSANQRRFTLNAKSGPNSIMSMDEQPRRQTQIQK